MNFGFTEDQEMIRDSAAGFVKNESSLERIRGLRGDALGYSKELWQTCIDNGWLSAVFPEEAGGLGLGYTDLICIMEEFGKGILPEPIVQTAVLAGSAIDHCGNDDQRNSLLPQIGEGTLIAVLAAYETAGRYDLAHVATTATASNGGYVLNGEKNLVEEVPSADKILITARTEGGTKDRDGITLFLIDANAEGVTATPVSTMDGRPRATLTLNNVHAGADAIIGSAGAALEGVERAVDCAAVALCAEMVGGMQAALNMTVAYSHERVQFDRPIGSFQALKHKAADMYMTLEIARSAMYYAAMATDQNMPDRALAVSAAKALCSEGYVAVTKEAIQMHGGIGFTDEHDIHLFYKRAIATAKTYGDARHHRERYLAAKLAETSSVGAAAPATV